MKRALLILFVVAVGLFSQPGPPIGGGGPPTGAAGGDLTGTYPNPGVAKLNSQTPGGTCTNQVVTSVNSSAIPTCASVTGAMHVANTIDYGQIATDVLQSVTMTLTSAQIKTLHSVPVTVVAAPGAGKYIEFVSAVTEVVFGTLQYQSGGTTNYNIGGISVGGSLANTAINNAVANNLYQAVPAAFSSAGTDLSSVLLNAALILSSTVDFTSGDGTLIIQVQYRIHSGF